MSIDRAKTRRRGSAITSGEVTDAALGLGAADGPNLWETFLSTVREVTIPGLERFGLHASWAFGRAVRRVVAA